MVGKMIMDGVRDPKKVANLLQTVVDEVATEVKVYLKRLQVITFGGVEVIIYELATNANLQQMFGELGGKRRCWKDKEEALSFSRQHKDKLGPNVNFFELEGDFVALVRLDPDGWPYVHNVDPRSDNYVWGAEYQHRVFYPQQ